MIDSHTHLEMVPGEDGDIVATAREAGVTRLLNIGMTPSSCRAALAASERFDGCVYAAIGRHPNSATGFDDVATADLAELARHPGCRAIGETGLDYHWDKAPREDQMRSFLAHISLAREAGKPLVIHTREAEEDTIAVLRDHAGGCTVILHCFSMAARLDECLEQGWFVSFAGNVTYPRNTELVEAAERVPLDRLLVETDAPFLTPQPVRKHRNQPAFVVHTAAWIAQRRGITYAELEAAVETTAAGLFGW